MSTQSYHISKQVLISAAKAFIDECKSTGIVPDQTVQSISKGTFNVRKEIGLKKKRAELKRLRRKLIEEKRDREMCDAKEKKLKNLETDITTKMAKVTLNSPCAATKISPCATTKVHQKVPKHPNGTPTNDPHATSSTSSFDDSVLDPDYSPSS